MDRNEKIVLIATSTIAIASTALFAISTSRAKKATAKLEAKMENIKIVVTHANAISA